MNNRVTTFLGGLAVIGIAVVFVTSFGPSGGQAVKTDPTCAAEVLGNCVKTTHYRASMRLMARMMNNDAAQQIDIAKKTMDGLIERELLLIEAKKLGLSISDEALTKELRAGRFRFSVPAGLPLEYRRFIPISAVGHGGYLDVSQGLVDPKTKQFSVEKYKRLVGDMTGMLEQDFREFQRQELVAERMRMLIAARVQVAEAEGKQEYLADYSTAKASFVKLRPAFYVDRAVDLSPAAIDAWATKNAAEIDGAVAERKKELGAECRDVSHIMLPVKPGPDAEKVKAKQRERLEAARKRIEGGESFADVARELSQDRGTRRLGGSLGCIVKNEMQGDMKSFADTLYAIEKDGEMGPLVETRQGVHLIRLDKRQSGPEAEKSLRARVARELYILAEGKRLAQDGGKEIQAAVKGGKKLDEAVADHLAKYPAPVPSKPAGGSDDKKDAKDAPKDAKDAPKDKDAADAKKDDAHEDHDDDFHLEIEEESIIPKVEKSKAFTSREEPFRDLAFGEVSGALLFAETMKVGDVLEKLVNVAGGGVAVIVLDERTIPTDEEWATEREKYLEPRRLLKRKEAIGDYLKRVRSQHTAAIKITEEFKPKAAASGSATPNAPPPGLPMPE